MLFRSCTIEPNIGIVEVPDPRIEKLITIVSPEKTQPAIVEFVDIAGLVAGASKGEGLGNKFLANIRETDAIVHVVRCFQDDNIVHVSGKVDPLSDIEVINTELILADMETVDKTLQRENKKAKSGDKEAIQLVSILTKISTHLDQGKLVKDLNLDDDELKLIKPLCLITVKPVMFVANVNETGFNNNPILDSLKALGQKENLPVISICAKIEAEIADLEDFYREAKKMFDDSDDFKDAARKAVVDLQGGDEATLAVWKVFCDESLKHCHEIYKHLDITITDRGESAYNDMLKDVVEDLKSAGRAVQTEGAWGVFLDGYKNKDDEPLPTIVQKSDGGYIYAKIGRAHV